MAHSALQLGDSIDIIAPGFRTNKEDVEKACVWLRSLGYEPRVPKDLYSPHFLHSAPDKTRLAHLKNALQSPSKVIWCLRGGYGSNRLLPELAKMKKPKHSKLLIGLSDITSIQMFLCMHWGWPSLHTSLLDRFAQKRVTAKIEKEILDLITGNTPEVTFQKLRPMNKAARVRKNINAPLWGGNMVTLQSLIKTNFTPNIKKPFILFLKK
ncbi:MAG: LD-carboxypeptidase, partial [Pseudobdellovibrionaceae bacterium]